MLQVVFSESEQGSLRVAQRCGGGSAGSGPIAFIGTDVDLSECPPKEREEILDRLREQWRQEENRARPVGGDPANVLCPSAALDIGALKGPEAEQGRVQLLWNMMREFAPVDPNNPNEKLCFLNTEENYRRDLDRLISGAKQGEPVRIWYSSAPYSLCGFYDTLWRLNDCDCVLTAIELPRWMELSDNTACSCLHWGEMAPGDWAAYLALEREVPRAVRSAIAMEWAQLRLENAPLRAVVNGRLQSVDETFYDGFIRSCIPAGKTFLAVQVIGDVLGRRRLGIGDWWIAKRLKAMLEQGELELVRQGDFFYRDELRKKS